MLKYNIVIIYLTIWLFVIVVLFLSVGTQMMLYSADIQQISNRPTYGRAAVDHMRILSEINARQEVLENRHVIIVYATQGTTVKYVREILCDGFSTLCISVTEALSCMETRHAQNTAGVINSCSEHDIDLYLCFLNKKLAGYVFTEICLNDRPSSLQPGPVSNDVNIESDEELLIVKSDLNRSKQNHNFPGKITQNTRIPPHGPLNTKRPYKIGKSHCIYRRDVIRYCQSQHLILFLDNDFTLRSILKLKIQDLKILHILPKDKTNFETLQKQHRPTGSHLFGFLFNRHPKIALDTMCSQFDNDMKALETISKAFRHRSYKAICPGESDWPKHSFKLELWNYLDLFSEEQVELEKSTANKRTLSNDNSRKIVLDDPLFNCLTRWRKICDNVSH